MRTQWAWAAGAAAIILAAPVAAEDFQWHGRIAAGKTVEIRGVNGSVDASAATGDEVEVTATKRAHRSDPESVRIEAVEHDGGVTICAVYPDSDGRPNECRTGGGHNNTRDNDVEVHFTVRIPRGVVFAPATVNGDVAVRGLEGDVHATTVNGSIDVATAGRVEAQTVNGSIRARAGRADWTSDVSFRTVNGSITLTLPASAAADVHAQTVNGEIETDFPLTVSGRLAPRRLSGSIGGGGHALEMQTVNGSIHLRKAS
ncbi:MAG TPA: DUF4097 family beta strand repeat-containing protein [Vicinamibacteria bacterium]|jgi:hypothetical protein|nr:DUF4097 family beta strand repeat-containing protein [Vicinamibacteria bacterium]